MPKARAVDILGLLYSFARRVCRLSILLPPNQNWACLPTSVQPWAAQVQVCKKCAADCSKKLAEEKCRWGLGQARRGEHCLRNVGRFPPMLLLWVTPNQIYAKFYYHTTWGVPV